MTLYSNDNITNEFSLFLSCRSASEFVDTINKGSLFEKALDFWSFKKKKRRMIRKIVQKRNETLGQLQQLLLLCAETAAASPARSSSSWAMKSSYLTFELTFEATNWLLTYMSQKGVVHNLEGNFEVIFSRLRPWRYRILPIQKKSKFIAIKSCPFQKCLTWSRSKVIG